MVKIIGIDPGLAATGIGIVRGLGSRIDSYSFGSIDTSKNTSLPSRLDKIFSKLLQLLKSEKPDMMVIEDVYSLNRYPKSGIVLGQVTGVIQLAGFHAAVPSTEVSVREAKQILTGNGNADKKQLEKAVRHRLNHNLPIKPVHASDAMGLALIGLYRYQDKVGTNTKKNLK
ncbi:MAG: crossover junction endodeoxyribonuclease RuvC [Desulfobacterales bacterium]|jgi:crossover junction endodeoxyribonuclease RuvC|nr:crossover junction endodeoxyribonuclease RuvC [Desulfobacterales bacterium]